MDETPQTRPVSIGRLASAIAVCTLLIGAFAYLKEDGVSSVALSLPWETSLDDALARARSEGKPVLVEIHAEWCAVCRKFEAATLAAPEVRARLDRLVLLRIDSDKDTEVAGRYGTAVLPTLVVLNAEGEAVSKGVGLLTPGEFVAFLDLAQDRLAEDAGDAGP